MRTLPPVIFSLKHTRTHTYSPFSSYFLAEHTPTHPHQDDADEKIQELIEVLDNQKEEAIQRTFKQVAKNFQQVFNELVPEGSASLLMQKPSDDDGSVRIVLCCVVLCVLCCVVLCCCVVCICRKQCFSLNVSHSHKHNNNNNSSSTTPPRSSSMWVWVFASTSWARAARRNCCSSSAAAKSRLWYVQSGILRRDREMV